MPSLPIHRAGYPWLVSLIVLFMITTGCLIRSAPLIGIIGLIILLGVNGILVWFFRDPERNWQGKGDCLVAPADGKVVAMNFGNRKDGSSNLAIYLSLFDVHVNRLPVSGTVTNRITRNGCFLPAFKHESGKKNASVTLEIETPHGSVQIKQIAGILARRGDLIVQGHRYGIIKFGSRVELFTEKPVQWLVSPGDRVKGGETLIGKWND